MARGRYFHAPPAWDDNELELRRRQAIEDFITERSAEGTARYQQAFRENVVLVTALFAATDDLVGLGTGGALSTNPRLVRPARYLAGPPISADDLDTLADVRIASRRRLDAELGRRAAHVIDAAMDRERFPWLFDAPARKPTAVERDVAIRWTAGLQTVQEIQTGRRSQSSARQEAAVERLLLDLGFAEVSPRPIDAAGGLASGEFCREAIVAGTKCDVPVGLRDGRFLFIECKVSNSATNSVKRLNRETGGKASLWRRVFGERAIPGAVLSGVFKLRNLKDAQNSGVTIFWERDLSPLSEFVRSSV